MKGRLFWLTTALLLGLAVHIAYILFVPRSQMDAKMAALTTLAGINRLAVIEPAALVDIIPEADPWFAYAVCVYDLASGPVRVRARIPQGYWLLSFYAPNGDSFYSLNDRQADVRELDVVVTDRPAEGAEEGTLGPALGGANSIVVRSPAEKGLALLRARVESPVLISRLKADLAASSCGPAT
jgi:uncharacterized membrane protein